MSQPVLHVHIPGNPWQGRVNARDRAALRRDGKPYNRKQAGYRAYQATVALWCAAACRAQGWRCTDREVAMRVVLGVPDHRRRDYDGPLKALGDGLRDGGAYRDDSQIWRATVEKRLGAVGAWVWIRERP